MENQMFIIKKPNDTYWVRHGGSSSYSLWSKTPGSAIKYKTLAGAERTLALRKSTTKEEALAHMKRMGMWLPPVDRGMYNGKPLIDDSNDFEAGLIVRDSEMWLDAEIVAL